MERICCELLIDYVSMYGQRYVSPADASRRFVRLLQWLITECAGYY